MRGHCYFQRHYLWIAEAANNLSPISGRDVLHLFLLQVAFHTSDERLCKLSMADVFQISSIFTVLFLSYIIFPAFQINKDTLLHRTTFQSNHCWVQNMTEYLCMQIYIGGAQCHKS